MKPPYAIGSVPSISGHATAYRWRSLSRVRRHRARKPQGSSERVLPWQITMDQLIFASLSHTHYWYEVGMLKVPMMSAFVMQITENDRLEYAGDTVLLRGDNVSAVSWLNRCGGARDKRAALVMRIMGRLEITSGWSHKAKHIPGVLNVLADGISRWQPDQIAEKLRSHVQEGDWRQVPLDQNSLEFLSILLQPAFPKERVDEGMWSLLTRDPSLSSPMSRRYNRDQKRRKG